MNSMKDSTFDDLLNWSDHFCLLFIFFMFFPKITSANSDYWDLSLGMDLMSVLHNTSTMIPSPALGVDRSFHEDHLIGYRFNEELFMLNTIAPNSRYQGITSITSALISFNFYDCSTFSPSLSTTSFGFGLALNSNILWINSPAMPLPPVNPGVLFDLRLSNRRGPPLMEWLGDKVFFDGKIGAFSAGQLGLLFLSLGIGLGF